MEKEAINSEKDKRYALEYGSRILEQIDELSMEIAEFEKNPSTLKSLPLDGLPRGHSSSPDAGMLNAMYRVERCEKKRKSLQHKLIFFDQRIQYLLAQSELPKQSKLVVFYKYILRWSWNQILESKAYKGISERSVYRYLKHGIIHLDLTTDDINQFSE